MSPIVITAYNPARRRMQISVAVTTLILIGCGVYEIAYRKASADKERALEENVRLTAQTTDLRQEITRLREQNALLDRNAQVEHQAYKEIEASVAALQSQVSSLKAEIAFYKTVSSPQEGARGIRVGGFEATPKGMENGYHFRVMLTQVQKNESVVEGDLTLDVEGQEKGQRKVVTLKQASPAHGAKVPFKFKYFGTVEGDLVFPAEFVPSRVTIKVSFKSRKHPDFDESIDWPFEEG